jgi:hypothetical protein
MPANSQRRRRSAKGRNRLTLLERLEDRCLLDASNVFAEFRGEVLASEQHDLARIHLAPGNFGIANGLATVGFLLRPETGSQFRPQPVHIDRLSPGNVTVLVEKTLADGSSFVLAKLKHADHDVEIVGLNNSRGTWQLDVFLAGDVTGDFLVNASDVDLLSAAVNGTIDAASLIPIGDSNRDGQITGFDLAIAATENRGVSTSVRVLSVTAELDPAYDTGVTDDNLVNRSAVSIVGHSQPGVTVSFDRDGDGFDDGTAVAVATSPYNFAFPANLVEGPNTLRVRAQDSFGQQGFASTVVVLDTVPPASPVFDLASASDSEPQGDGRTIDEIVALAGLTEPFAAVVLEPLGLVTTAHADGRFEFSGIRLELGENAFVARAQDAAGNQNQFDKTIVRLVSETDPPEVVAALANDTAPEGATNTDGITADPALSATISDQSRIVSVRIGLDDAPVFAFAEAVADLQADGSLYLSRSRLEELLGTAMADGPHRLHVRATDLAGNVSDISTVAFVLDATAPTSPAIDLSLGSDSGIIGDQTTSAGKVTLVGQSEPNAHVTLNGSLASALVSNSGVFFLSDISLAVGENAFTVLAVDLAGNESSTGSASRLRRIQYYAGTKPHWRRSAWMLPRRRWRRETWQC